MRNGIKNILMILQSDFPPDMRVQKEAVSLLHAGYKVTLLCDNRIPRERFVEYQGIKIIRMKHFFGFSGKWHKIINAPMYPNPFWLRAIRKTAQNINADVLHVHDLPLALSTIKIGKQFGIPIVFDLHENYPMAMKLWYKPGPAGWTVRNPQLAKRLERKCLQQADKIIVIAEEHRDLLISRGISTEKIYIVENTPYQKLATPQKALSTENEISTEYKKFKTLLYFGKINPERHLEIAIRALPIVKKKIPDIKLIIVGDGPSFQYIKNESRKLGINDLVDFTGWIDLDEALPYFYAADACIMPHGSNDFLDMGVPNKLFEYMAMAKPVIIPESKASARVVREAGCGEIFMPGSVESFAKAVLRVLQSENSAGEKGRELILEKYNWEQTEKNLLTLYATLQHKNNQHRTV